MRTIETIFELTRDELEQFRNEILNEFHIDSEALPFSVFAALRNTPNVAPVSNGMFYILLHHLTSDQTNSCRFGSTTQWLDNENIKGWILLPFQRTNYILFLTNEQREILERIKDIIHNYSSSEDRLREIAAITDNVLETTPLTDEEKNHPLAVPYHVPANSGSLNVAEHTSRFSGASWFEEIQKKTIILAGLGGIGSYVCFLLARVQPTSLFIYDDDIVEAANMSGQLYGLSDIGQHKVDAIAAMVGNYASYNSVFAIRDRFTNSCEAADIMICGFDNMTARKIFFRKWCSHVNNKSLEERKKCLFIDGRLSAEYLQVFSFTGDDEGAINKYSENALFSDAEADETVCSYKQTTYMANMIGSLMVNVFTNFVANEVAGAPIRELPYLTSYDGNSMQLKIE